MTSSPAAEAYPGNPSLPQEVRQKILSTFRHALNLFSSGNLNDCLIGCEFILKMDPRFVPARTLRDRARSPEGNRDISDLQALISPGASPAPAAEPLSPPPPAPKARGTGAVEPTTPSPARTTGSVQPDPQESLAEAARRLAARDFDNAIAVASRVLSLVPGNPEALEIVEKAAGKKAMQPLVKTGLERAELALEENRLSEARMELDQMRLMDPEHPALGPLEQRLESVSSGAAPVSGLSLDQEETGPFAIGGHDREPAFFDEPPEPPPTEPPPAESEQLRPLGMDSFSLDAFSPAEPPPAPSPPSQDFFVPPRETPAPATSQPEVEAAASGLQPTTPLDLAKPAEEEGPSPGGGEREIAALLKQGDEAARKGNREQAIEIWSRVFLIDINNMGAVTRIEKVRQEMAEESRLIADCLKKGRETFEAGQLEEARRFFTQVQSIDPDEPTARFYLERMAEGTKEPALSPVPGASPKPAEPARVEAVLPRPAPAPPEIVPAPVSPRPAFLGIHPRVLAVVGAFLVMTLIGAYFVFKNPQTRSSPPQAAPAGSLAHARQLMSRGKVAEARAELRRVPPDDPDSGEAQRLLEELGKPGGPEVLAGKGARPTPLAGEGSASPGGEGDPARLRSAGEQALGEKRYIDALKNFNLAGQAYRNDPSFAQEQALASEKVAALTPAVKLYNEGEYETAIPVLWRLVQEDRDNRDARSYLLRAYYNQGITQLQNGLYPKAIQAFQEALSLDPNDAEAARHKKFAARYQKADLDLMGRIYVRHLSHRP